MPVHLHIVSSKLVPSKFFVCIFAYEAWIISYIQDALRSSYAPSPWPASVIVSYYPLCPKTMFVSVHSQSKGCISIFFHHVHFVCRKLGKHLADKPFCEISIKTQIKHSLYPYSPTPTSVLTARL